MGKLNHTALKNNVTLRMKKVVYILVDSFKSLCVLHCYRQSISFSLWHIAWVGRKINAIETEGGREGERERESI